MTVLLMMSTGMSRMSVSLLRNRLGQRTEMSNNFSPSTICDRAVRPRALVTDVVDVGRAHTPALHF